MTGKISVLNPTGSSGVIRGEDGARVHFNASDLLAYDLDRLAVGQSVSFDLKDNRLPEAMNVHVRRSSLSAEPKVPAGSISTRYMGFRHSGHIRSYQYELTLPGQEMRRIVIHVDLRLLKKHSILMQDGLA